MSDVMQIAYEYRHQLKAELAKVDEFIRLAEKLMKGGVADAPAPLTSATNQATSPAPRADAPSRPLVSEVTAAPLAAAIQAAAVPTPGKRGRGSLFRGAFEPCEVDREKIVA